MDRYTPWAAFREASLWILAIPIVLPIFFLISLSFKTTREATGSAFALPSSPTFDNYSRAWDVVGGGTASFAQALFNSVATTVCVVALLVVLGAPAGYVIARKANRLASAAFGLFALGLVLPMQLGIIPLFIFMAEIGLAGTLLGLILVYTGVLMPLAVFLFTGFFRALPPAYEEAALVDGASRGRILFQIVLPLMKPVTGTVAVLAGLIVWNDFFLPLVLVGGTDKITLPVAIYSLVGSFSTDWSLIFASSTIALAPIIVVYVLLRKFIMNGFAGAVRG